MCGIAGIYYQNAANANKEQIKKMTDALAHRGPDDEGIYIKNHVGLGHRRLSILDLSSQGHQPMTYQGSGYWIVYNGEVYNYIELRNTLKQKGYIFKSNTDTEVVLAAYIEWGEQAFEKFNGMWALAIYSEKNDELLLCRDRYGIKPLFYYYNKQTLVFASECKALYAIKNQLDLDFDIKGIATALKSPFDLEASGNTLFTNVFNLLPGRIVNVNQTDIREKVWWRTLDNLVDVPDSLEEQAEEFRHLFTDACKLRMRSDVPVGTSLSGGLDSSSVVAMLAHLKYKDNRAFIHTFKGTSQDETEYATIVVESFGIPCVYVEANKSDFLTKLDNTLYCLESVYQGMPDSYYRIYQSQRTHGIIVSLDGHGADEMLGGYAWYLDEALKDINPLLNFKRFKELLMIKDAMVSSNPQVRDRLYLLKSLLRNTGFLQGIKEGYKKYFKPERLSQRFLQNVDSFHEPQTTELPKQWSHLQKKLYTEFHHSTLPRILKVYDAMSMANSVEVRMPFMDYRIVNFVFSLPDEAKIGNGFTKNVLREAMSGILDDRVRLRRTKIGFNSPVVDWFQKDMRTWIEEILYNPQYTIEVINKKELKTFYEHKIKSGRFSWGEGLEFWKYLNALKLTTFF